MITDKMKMHSPDLSQQNVEKLKALFPNCVTEAADESGKLVSSIDFDLLKQELSDHIVEGPQERYRLDWPGKREALLTANAPIAKTLRPARDESVDFDTTKNLFIEGDNLDALKLLQETYLGKVKMIYIDPPYNTGNDFIYEDDFAENTASYMERSNQVDEEGNRLVANNDSNGRFHSDWLSMIYPRLKLARNLLRDDGVIFISIDDNEQANLKRLCDEVFGEKNFIGNIVVQINPRGRHLDKYLAKTHEYILGYLKNGLNKNSITGIEKNDRMIGEYNREDDFGKYRLLGLRNRNQTFNPITRPKLYYPLYVDKITGMVSLEKSDDYTDEIYPVSPEGVRTCWTWGKEKVKKESNLLIAEKTGSEWRIYRKDYLFSENGIIAKTLAKSIWLDKEMTNDYGRKSIKELFDISLMDFPKSKFTIQQLVTMACNHDSTILDFFAGSGTTAHAVMHSNAEDGGKRQCISVQLPEVADEKSEAYKAGYKTIAEISKERIRRAGKKFCEENPDADLDIGFRVLKVDTSNMEDVYYRPDETAQDDLLTVVNNIKPDRTAEDLLFQVLLDWGVDLTLPIVKRTIAGKSVYFVDDNALAACFEHGIDEALVKELAQHHPIRVVFRDNGFASDAVKINVTQIFKLMSPDTDVRTI